ncbi:MAG: guanylate kinase [Firmicutes bacterium]|nr:guanylate kinase [Bacillota bacterium]
MSKLLFIISGPSGAGKNTVMTYIRKEFPQISKAVTYTTRAPRPHERDGVDYRFVSEADFFQKVREGKILEYEQVYNDYYYGSPADIFDYADNIIMEMDWKGHRTYRAQYTDVAIVSIFLVPPSLSEIKNRILKRSRVENLNSRLANALEQLSHADEYSYIVINEHKRAMLTTIEAIVRTELLRSGRERNLEFIRSVIQQGKDANS